MKPRMLLEQHGSKVVPFVSFKSSCVALPASVSKSADRGFSLIELVVVIAVLGVLTAIALPTFQNVRKDAQVSQVKNALAIILKECKVAAIRDKPTVLSSIPSARASLSGFVLSSQGNFGLDFLNGDCFKDVSGSRTITISARAVADSEVNALRLFPVFAINYNDDTGKVSRTCKISADTEYTGGCNAVFEECVEDEFGDPICPVGNGKGTW